jgi:peptidoglycan/LPS O-acetylase OafA/YrhL
MKSPFLAMAQGQTSWSLLLMPEDLIVTAFFASVLLGSPLPRAVLRWRFLAFVGMISYSMFLLHHTVLLMAAHFLPGIGNWMTGRSSFAVWAAFSGYALAILMMAGTIAYFSYRYIESPFLRYKPK